MATRRQYSDNDKAAALAALDANGGNVLKTAHEIGIARKTLEGWSKDRGVHPEVAELRHENGLALIDMFRAELFEIFAAMPAKRSEATYAQLATAAGIFNDKVLLLEGKPTARTEAMAKVEHAIDEHSTDRLSEVARILFEVGAFEDRESNPLTQTEDQ